jgi:metal-sulfur cluster biosynthetic enzyme/Fe-S cluster assembly iron-binding protein IscA
MGEARKKPSDTPGSAGPDSLRITATKEAIRALENALSTQAKGKGLRIWVETGIHPQVRMMIDRASERDLQVAVGTVPVFVDSLSQRFLQDAEVRYLRVDGREGFHLVGPNVPGGIVAPPTPPATGGAVAPSSAPSSGSDHAPVEERIRSALKQIYDPEIPMNLVDLGLIYGFDWRGPNAVTIRMTLTSVGCPSTEAIMREVEAAARKASGLAEIKVEIVWEPLWSPERMSLFAKRQFGYV